jgi:hypothetical protein
MQFSGRRLGIKHSVPVFAVGLLRHAEVRFDRHESRGAHDFILLAFTLQSGAMSSWFAVIVIFSGQAMAQTPAQKPETAACRKFTQEFYDWYVPITKKRMQQPASNLAIQRKPEAFSPGLLKALKIDAEASARVKDDIVGLDFDPFLSSQDPSSRYEARAVTWQGEKCSVEVWGVSSTGASAKSRKPDAVAEVAFVRGHWEFQNFRYPELGSDLVSVLVELEKERRKP